MFKSFRTWSSIPRNKPFLYLKSGLKWRGMKTQTNVEMDPLLENMDKLQVEQMHKDMCIIVDENDRIIGPKSKRDCHLMENISKGLLHRAFSVLIFNKKGEFLLTQRANTKITFPNYYTNACCSHPLYTQSEMEERNAIGIKRAAQRRLNIELGIDPLQIPLSEMVYMTRVLYKAPSNGIWGEHEIDYFLIINKDVDMKPNKSEIMATEFLSKNDLKTFIDSANKNKKLVTPWFKMAYDTLLDSWWNNLDRLEKYQDHEKIHRI